MGWFKLSYWRDICYVHFCMCILFVFSCQKYTVQRVYIEFLRGLNFRAVVQEHTDIIQAI